jgi:hypothetical protein
MRTGWKKIRYRLEWLALKSATKFLPLCRAKLVIGWPFCSARSALCLGKRHQADRRVADPAWKQCPVVRSASSVCFSHLAPPPREASQIDDPPKDRWRNVMFPLDI